MKLLLYLCNSYYDPDLCYILDRMHISYDSFTYDFNKYGRDKNHDPEFISYFTNDVYSSSYSAVFSIDYWPPVAEACYKMNIKYISWSYDCPLDIKFPEETLQYPNITLYLFDKHEVQKFNNLGFNNVKYLPLGVNSYRYRNIKENDKKCIKYKSEVSFVGKLYENSFPVISHYVNPKTQQLLNNIVETQRNLPQTYILDSIITDNFVNLISQEMHENIKSFSDTVTKSKVIYAIESQIARLDRILLLNLCGKRYKTSLYSGSGFDLLEGVECHAYINYWSEMPYVFAASNINLNPVLPSIHTGLNLRAFDITACGGFMLINHQSELEDFFIPDKEVVVYDSINEFVEKLEYYMKNESKRKEIALAGRNRCLSEHTLQSRLNTIMNNI